MKPGSYVEIKTKTGEILKGKIMQTNDSKMLSIKLDSGYNIGLNKKNILYMNELKEKLEVKQKQTLEIKQNKNLKTITILHMGGTIASKVNYKSGAVTASFTPEEIITMFPELKNIANIKSRLISNMFSGDMRLAHYNIIAKEIEKELNSGVDGIIVTHGTDTLAFTSAALSFALENINKPVILVGAQRSSDRPSTDAAMNSLCAVNFIIKSNFNEVGICMHGKSGDDFCYILPGLKTKKLHTSRRDAFKAVNSNPIAKITKEGNIEFLQDYKKKEHKEKLKLILFNEKLKIGILKVHPGMWRDEIKVYSKFHGLIIEGTGLGHLNVDKIDKFTSENEAVYKEIKKLAKKFPVVMTTQCIFGRVNMNVYEYGRKLQEAGVLGNYSDMTSETAFIKLAWLLSNYKKSQIKDLINFDFRGEISKRVTYEEEFI